MRLWSLDPSYLDAKGLVACWREALLAQAVLAGRTKGYTHHPQLERFREAPDPLAAIAAYLEGIAAEATRRGYHFDTTRIIRGAVGTGAGVGVNGAGAVDVGSSGAVPSAGTGSAGTGSAGTGSAGGSGSRGEDRAALAPLRHSMDVTTGQLALERRHLLAKLRQRSPADVSRLEEVGEDGVEPHPLFRRVPGGVADWERTTGTRR
ncbi:pyrimidine dimer DNA glycosylase/endonuclease V [Actinomyces sp.]|uniref:pyrimidine dimer DNA glycosylase/endonuclease V n=1 Tax=Actinomyces sp. TaxID=29317 RepID=UPI002896A532|nr:pyrimidine dimer DNA glycosylase/endonuclease V [Actinomyces sp.]